jgi:hypothetical protein
MRTRKTKTRTRIKFAAAVLGALLAAAPVSSAQPSNGKASTKKSSSYAVIAGTVFRDPGFAQPGAAIWITRKDDPKEKKLQAAVSDSRGEFAFRVAPVQAAYELHATLKGYRPVRQDIQIEGEEQVNATLLLVPESN